MLNIPNLLHELVTTGILDFSSDKKLKGQIVLDKNSYEKKHKLLEITGYHNLT